MKTTTATTQSMNTINTRLLGTLAIGIGFVMTSLSSHAASYALDDIDGVRIVDSDLNGSGDAVQRNQLWAGNIAGSDWGVVFVYELPTLGLDEKVVTSADFSAFKFASSGNPDLLVSVFTRSTQAVQAADYQGAGTGYTSSVVDLETDFADGPNSVAYSLTTTGQDSLISFLDENKDDDYLFVRVRANGTPVGGQAYQFGNTNGDQTAAVTTLSFTAVPEPSSSALLGLGGVALLLRRRR